MIDRKKASNIFRLLGGGYLSYIGIRLILDVHQSKPANEVILMVIGCAFILLGLGFVGYTLLCLYREKRTVRNDNENVNVEPDDRFRSGETKERTNKDVPDIQFSSAHLKDGGAAGSGDISPAGECKEKKEENDDNENLARENGNDFPGVREHGSGNNESDRESLSRKELKREVPKNEGTNTNKLSKEQSAETDSKKEQSKKEESGKEQSQKDPDKEGLNKIWTDREQTKREQSTENDPGHEEADREGKSGGVSDRQMEENV